VVTAWWQLLRSCGFNMCTRHMTTIIMILKVKEPLNTCACLQMAREVK
jgi:hypothetical protein